MYSYVIALILTTVIDLIRILLLGVNGPTSDHNSAYAFTDVVDGEHMKARQNLARGANH